ncbi:MAG: lipoprotein-releasing ABC transporter permease subunit [Proteobacteria bacterium]|nr:lipoprotein-releasing ABC transporter permease subunit [Pseudomonadota bacterium]
MFTPVEAYLGWRYTRAKRRIHFVSLISAIAMLGVALGVAALITILSIMNGFEGELRDRILGMAAHVVVTTERGVLSDWQTMADRADQQAGVLASAPYIRREAMLTHYDNVQGAVVRGILPGAEEKVSIVAQKIIDGDMNLKPGSFDIVLGRGLADALQARVGSRVTLIAPEPMRTPAGMVPRLRRYDVIGIFEAGVQDDDTSLALIHIDDAKKMFRYGDQITGIRLTVDNPFDAPAIGQEIAQLLSSRTDDPVKVIDWTETNINLFKALKTEKIVMFIILALTIAVAAFNLVSTLVMVVSEKTSEIAILQTLGLTKKKIILVFFIHGGLIGISGIVLGLALGLVLASNVQFIVGGIETFLHFKILSPEVYYISEIPSEIEFRDVLTAVGVALILCLLAPLYPALLASRTAPAQALRYD